MAVVLEQFSIDNAELLLVASSVVVLPDNSFEDVLNSLYKNWRMISGHLISQVLSIGIR